MKHLVLALVAIGLASPAFGNDEIYVNAALFYAQETRKVDDSEYELNKAYYHLGVGMKMGSGLLLGLKYVQLDEGSKTDVTDESTAALSGYGPSLGYMHDSGFGLMATYLLEPEKEVESGSASATWKGGTGHVIDVGYYFEGSGFAIGPQLSLVSGTYKTIESGGEEVDLTNEYEETYLYPYVGFFFYF